MASFLLLKDSRASYAIEGERPPQDRVQRWARAIGEAGRHPIDSDELLRLQRVVIGDDRFVKLGFRTEGGFIGEHDRVTGAPLPEHISARPEDLGSLASGMVAFDRESAPELDAVIAAAVLAFGFVYVPPLRGRQRPGPPVPGPSSSGRARLQSSGRRAEARCDGRGPPPTASTMTWIALRRIGSLMIQPAKAQPKWMCSRARARAWTPATE